jgi:iron complex transport system ATP-binding protein
MTLSAAGVVAGYGSRTVLHGVDLDLEPGVLTAIIGPNGAGKSTLLRCLAGLLRPSGGRVLLDGHDLRGLDRGTIARRIAVVPQMSETIFPFTVREIVGLGRVARLGVLARVTALDTAAVDRAIAELDLTGLATRRIDTLSGGERQRAVLAMALAQEPRVLLLDEPTVHLDPAHQRSALDHIRRLVQDRELTCVAVLHDLNLASAMCERVVVVDGGRVAADGDPTTVIDAPTIASVFGPGLVVGERGGVPFVLPAR